MSFHSPLTSIGPFQRAWLWQAGVYISFWAELRLFALNTGPLLNPILFYASSVLLCVFAALYWCDRPFPQPDMAQATRRFPFAWAGLLLGAVAVLYVQIPAMAAHPLGRGDSDIIPVVQAHVSRFRSGEVVYRYITTLPYPLFPNYLPLQWLPYVPADKLGIDYRWWALGLLVLVGFGTYQLTLAKQRLTWVGFLLKVSLPAYVLYRLIKKGPEIYSNTVEPTIIAYYCILAASVLSRSALLQGAALLLCLLSRYSVIFWVPFYLWMLWREAGLRHVLTVAGIVAAGVLGIYVVPFLSKDWTIFPHALNAYQIAALGEWGRTDGSNGHPPHLFAGLGFAAWFYTYGPADLADRIRLAQLADVVFSVGAVGLVARLYWRLRHRFDYRIVALISLKFYLATFYAFIQVPYAYLTSLGLFISVFVVMMTGAGEPVAATSPEERRAVLQ